MRHILFMLIALVAAIPNMAQAQTAGRLDKLKYVDIRDLATYGTELAGTASLLMRRLSATPANFAGSTHLTFLAQGPQGPAGTTVDVDGLSTFSITEDRSATYKNTILSVAIENIVEEEFDKVFKINLILFAHDDQVEILRPSNGYYFRRLTVRVNWNLPKEPESGRVSILSVDQDIPLANTTFRLLGDLLARKMILEEPTYGIKFVYPIAVGSFDIRTGPGMDQSAKLMTQEFPNATIKKVSVLNLGTDGPNTRTRTRPSYYTGRPFIGLFQNGVNYEQVGMHYQITSPNLVRGFVSHGCIRTRDLDLYRLDAILNEGPHDSLQVTVLNRLTGYETIDHPMPKVQNFFNQVVYSSLPTASTVACEHNKTYSVRTDGRYHTVADEDCLTTVTEQQRSPEEVINYITGQSTLPPMSMLRDLQHYPIAVAEGQIQPDLSSPEGGEIYKAQQQERVCVFFRCRNRPVRQTNPGASAPLPQRLAFADSEIAFFTDKWQRGCGRRAHLFGPSRKTCNDWATYIDRMKQFKQNNGQ